MFYYILFPQICWKMIVAWCRTRSLISGDDTGRSQAYSPVDIGKGDPTGDPSIQEIFYTGPVGYDRTLKYQ